MKQLTLILRRDWKGRWWLTVSHGEAGRRIDRGTRQVSEDTALLLTALVQVDGQQVLDGF
jgi:hypothetical protein